MTSPKIGSLRESLASALPFSFHCKIRYVHTPPKRCDALFSPPPGSEPEKTRLASHFLTVSIKPKGDAISSDVLVLGIEALVYHTKQVTTIFVSKADSTGYLPQQRPSPVQRICTAFLRWLSAKEREKHPSRDVVISLFARSQSQYLFPGSAENASKHVLDDRQLIKWWARVLHPLFPNQQNDLTYDGYITVPGYEGMEVRSFFPPSAAIGKQWHPGNPLVALAERRGLSRDAPPRCLLPRFPDDPKARFMQDLDDEVGLSEDSTASPTKRKTGKWKSIWNVDRFWEGMEFRQECSSGRMVGFIWLVIQNPELKRMALEQEANGDAEEGSQESASASKDAKPLSSESYSQAERLASRSQSPNKRKRRPLTGPIVARQPRLKGGASSLTSTSGLDTMLNTALDDGVVLSKEGYDQAMQSLLHADFANMDIAAQSTTKWAREVASICGIQTDWALDVAGVSEPAEHTGTSGANGSAQVNTIGVRKKRKAETSANGDAVAESKTQIAEHERPTINTLGGGMVRKKPKDTAP